MSNESAHFKMVNTLIGHTTPRQKQSDFELKYCNLQITMHFIEVDI